MKEQTKSIYTKSNPYISTLSDKKLLSSLKSSKEVYFASFKIDESQIQYEPGDSLGIMPMNSDDLTTSIIQAGNFNSSKVINDKSFLDIIKSQKEIRLPSNKFVSFIAKQTKDKKLNELLLDKSKINDYLYGRELLDFFNDFDFDISEEQFLELTKPLTPRLYSIASSQNMYKQEVHLIIAKVQYSFNKRICKGVASSFITESLQTQDKTGIFVRKNKSFKIPKNNDLPMIMVGPGTGIAPFIAFVQERISKGANGINWLFFGDRNKEYDFIYKDILTKWQNEGKLKLSLAWSRDKVNKQYVQDMMKIQGQEIFSLLEQGGYFFVCGDASKMAKDVNSALIQIVQDFGKLSTCSAQEYVQNLKQQKRYVSDVY